MFENVPGSGGQPRTPKEEKNWGPWKPVEQQPGYNPPDTKPEISTVLSKYAGAGTEGGGLPDDRRSRRIVFLVAAFLVVGGVGVGIALTLNRAKTSSKNDNANASNQTVNATVNENVNLSTVFPSFDNVNAGSNGNVEVTANGNTNVTENVNATTENANANLNVNTSVVEDPDRDGLTDEQEKIYKTDPRNPDTDGDGFLDGAEVQNGYNPRGEGRL